jgi:hypothetical protein
MHDLAKVLGANVLSLTDKEAYALELLVTGPRKEVWISGPPVFERQKGRISSTGREELLAFFRPVQARRQNADQSTSWKKSGRESA